MATQVKPKVNEELQALLPPLATAEREALEADIAVNGVLQAIVVDENGNILDGMTRYAIAGDECPVRAIEGLSWPEKKAFTVRCNNIRRNLSTTQKDDLRSSMVEIAKQLRQLDPPKTQAEIAVELGVSRQWVTKWLDATVATRGNRSHAQVKMTPDQKAEAVERCKAGETQEQVAADYGASRQGIAKEVAKAKKAEEKAAELKRQAEEAEREAKQSKRPAWAVLTGQACELFQQLANDGDDRFDWPQCIIADPPYNIGLDYGDGVDDAMSDQAYLKWSQQWISGAWDVAEEGASFWLIVNYEYAHHLRLIAEQVGWQLANYVIWYESFGVQCQGKFARCHRHCLHFMAGGEAYFDADAMRVPSKRQTQYNDSRADPRGKVMEDVWMDIPRLVGNADERIEGQTQLPVELIKRMVTATCPPGGTVLDPFSGSGTSGVAAVSAGRKYIGFELNEERAHRSRGRIRKDLQ